MCILPAVFVMPFFFLGYPILIFEKASAFDAIKKSFDIVQNNYGTILLTALLAGLISIAGVVLCCVGIYLTIPVCLHRNVFYLLRLLWDAETIKSIKK